MKKTIKKLKLVSYICLAVFLLNSCTQEKEFINEHNQPKIKFEEKSFKEALNLSLFNDALKKVSKQKGALRSEDVARTALEDQYGFTIVTDAPIRIITDENGIVSYTILIEREVKEELKFENLMIKVEDEETTAAIFKYTMAEKGTKTPTGDYNVRDIMSSVFTDLNVEGKMFFNSDGDTCFDINVVLCNLADDRPAGHVATAACWYHFNNAQNASNIYYTTSVSCIGGSGIGMGGSGGTGGNIGGGDTGGQSSNNTGGLGGSGGNNQPINVTPIPCRTGNCMEADVPVDPCDTLEEIFDPQKMNIEGILSTLIQNAENREEGEEGYSFQRKIASNGTVSFPNEIHRDGGANSVLLDVGFDIFGCIHIHPTNLVNMFSFADIFDVDRFYRAASDDNKNRIIYMLVTEDGNIYAMQLTDYNKYRQFIQSYYNTPYLGLNYNHSKKIEKANEAFNDALIKNSNSSPQNLQKRFAKLIENSGLDFYRLDGYAPRVWKKIKAGENDNSDPIVTSPCN